MKQTLKPTKIMAFSSNSKDLFSTRSMADEVYDHLESCILNMQYTPGTIMNECDIADSLNISRSPVREALLRLEQVNLVQKSGRTRVVSYITPENICCYYEMWEMAEPYIAGLACLSATEKQLAAIRDVLLEMDQYAHKDSINVYRELNLRFHSLLAEPCNNFRLVDFHNMILKHIRWGSNYSLSIIEDSQQSSTGHHDIFYAYENKDRAKTEELVRKHIALASDRIQKKYEKQRMNGDS